MLSVFDETAVALVMQIDATKEGAVEENEAKARRKAELASPSCAHGYGDAGMFQGAMEDYEHGPIEAVAAAAAGFGPSATAAAGTSGQEAAKG
jgi:hypothetical protein